MDRVITINMQYCFEYSMPILCPMQIYNNNDNNNNNNNANIPLTNKGGTSGGTT